MEGQYRRHWGFAPALWNLHFRVRVNLGASLSIARSLGAGAGHESVDTDAAIAAADLYEKLEKGYYPDAKGKRRKINGDVSKLYRANLSNLQRRLMADFRFRCGAIPGTQEIRTKIGHIGLWACVKYGNGIFCTISPGERHNYLACKLSRYRVDDPYVADPAKQRWAGKDQPRLEPNPEDEFEVNVPGYDARRLLLAEDPLAAANAFFVQIRTILATMLGVRMCPECPHCADGRWPCQDAFGSVAEPMGGIAGRVGALFGAVEALKTTGGLHDHFFMLV